MSRDDSDRGRCVSNVSYHLHPFISIVHSDEFRQFQQDSATSHTSRVATKWLQEHFSDIRHFHCPLKSLYMKYMKIIEPIWVAMQCAVQKRFSPPGTPTDLRTALHDSWFEIPSRIPSDISRYHATSCCITSVCSCWP
ncbi:hypothetical protein AVEN_89705-1 [Araneus ventricosus]|uniref:Tc1-like transposase DDE domain-containing protein n=1 Tax=Araneus ventricosus TaxID=182803 RepID=A0A4Y2DND8_ARAVE|nr:hypothetical protein AVEN_89705-1 [Araneus ventricosus]